MRFKAGDRVKTVGYDFYGPPVSPDKEGVCSLIAGINGKRVYCDPRKMLVFVTWDDGNQFSVPAKILERVA
jgi:hypothetical protein